MSNAVYGPANELKQVSYLNPANGGTVTETRSYNGRLQLTEINVPGIMDMTYTYPLAPANSGLIMKQKDNVSGEEISYQYDALNRLISASTTDLAWGLSFSYDGFGNRLNQTITKGTALPMYLSVDMSTNRINTAGYAYDANGNLTTVPDPSGLALTYDIENRLQTVNGGSPYLYGLDNKRVVDWGGNTLNFYTPDGRKVNSLALNVNGSTWQFQSIGLNYYFGGKLVQSKGQLVITDRLGSVRANLSTGGHLKYFPYGEENASPTTANDREKFATYTRDSSSGLDYADQRYYSSSTGRFTTADPYMASGGQESPQGWNRYAYVEGKPANFYDPSGQNMADPDNNLATCAPFQLWDGPLRPGCQWGGGGAGASQGNGVACEALSANGFLPTPTPGPFSPCYDPEPAATPSSVPTCTIDFEYRGISNFDPGLVVGAGHSYLHVTTRAADYVVEGFNNRGLLNAQETDHGLPNDSKGKDYSAGHITAPVVCSWLSILDSSAARVNADKVTYNERGPNSNTVVFYMLSLLPRIPGGLSWWSDPGLIGFYAYRF